MRDALTLARRWALGLISLLGCASAGAAPRLSTPNAVVDSYALLTLTDIATLALSPRGERLAFVTQRAVLETNTYDCWLYVIDTRPGAIPTRLGKVTPALSVESGFVTRRLKWAMDGRAVTYIANLDGHDQVWLWSVSGGPPRRVSNAATDVVSQDVLDDGHTVFYTTIVAQQSPGERLEIERTALREGMVFAEPVYWGDYRGPAGVAQYAAQQSGARYEHWVTNLISGQSRALAGSEGFEGSMDFPGNDEIDSYRLRRLNMPPVAARASDSPNARTRGSAVSPDARRTAVVVREIKDGRREFAIYVNYPHDEQRVEWYRGLEAGVSSLKWASDSRTLYFYAHQNATKDRNQAGIFRAQEGRTVPTAVFLTKGAINADGVRSLEVAYDQGAKKAAFVLSTSTQPGRIALLDLASGRIQFLFDPNPEFPGAKLQRPILLEWTNRYGVEAFGYFVPPTNLIPGETYPLVVVTYRARGFLRGGTGDEYPIWPLAANGFAVLALDAGNNHASWADGDDFALFSRYRSALATLETALQAVRRFDYVDLDRVALTGLSYSADTGWYALTHSNLFRTAIFSDFGADPWMFYLRGHQLAGGPARHVYGIPVYTEQDRSRWREVSVSMNASNINAPILVNNADTEFDDGLEAVATLRALGKPVELIIYPHAGHIINQPAQRYSIYLRNIEWLRFWLSDQDLAAPSKSDQYFRWRVLKEQQEWNTRRAGGAQAASAEYLELMRSVALGTSPVASQDLPPMLRAQVRQDAR